jgi:hypothetical protein
MASESSESEPRPMLNASFGRSRADPKWPPACPQVCKAQQAYRSRHVHHHVHGVRQPSACALATLLLTTSWCGRPITPSYAMREARGGKDMDQKVNDGLAILARGLGGLWEAERRSGASYGSLRRARIALGGDTNGAEWQAFAASLPELPSGTPDSPCTKPRGHPRPRRPKWCGQPAARSHTGASGTEIE